MRNFLLLSAAYLSGPRVKGIGKEIEVLRRGIAGKKPRDTIVKATTVKTMGDGAGKPVSTRSAPVTVERGRQGLTRNE